MNKKTYIKPSIETTELIGDVMMYSGSDIWYVDPDAPEVDTEQPGGQLAPSRRGKWGDLWYVEEE